jgi:hypothetical protein
VPDTHTEESESASRGASRFADSGTILLIVLFAITLILITTFTGPAGESVLGKAGVAFGSASMVVVVWLLAAAGFGAWFLRWLPKELSQEVGPGTRLLCALGLGTPLLLFAASALGTAGLLTTVTGWGLLIVGIILFAMGIRTSSRRFRIGAGEGWLPPFTWTAAPAIAVLLVAAVSAPGWLWQTEYGGYDALSYHLQLPREWYSNGRIFTPTWNVYGSLPSLVEAGYFHLMVVERNPLSVAISAQVLHASFALLAAATTGVAVGRWFDASRIGVGFALLMGTPWVIVVGSLAYNEMVAAFMLATAMLLFVPDSNAPRVDRAGARARAGVAAGLLAGAACAAKLTAVGFVALPVAYLLIRRLRSVGWRDAAPMGALAGLVVLAPWLIRNLDATGNPVFPFFSSMFGTGHFTEDQISRFQAAHTSTEGLIGRFGHLWNQIIRYGIGPDPLNGDPWRAQWSLLPILAGLGILVGFLRTSTRRVTRDLLILVAIPCVFWLSVTHLKSRFLVPAAPILVAASMLLLPKDLSSARVPARAWRVVISIALLAWCLWPVRLFQTDRIREEAPASAMMVGRIDIATGLYFVTEAQNQTTKEDALKVIHMGGPNATLALLPPGERILALGNATPFLMPRPVEYTTVWDNHPLAELLEEHRGDPDAVVRALRERGTTLLLVNPTMLGVWEQSGWLDPRLDLAAVSRVLERLEVEVRWPTGEVLLRIPPTEEPEGS